MLLIFIIIIIIFIIKEKPDFPDSSKQRSQGSTIEIAKLGK